MDKSTDFSVFAQKLAVVFQGERSPEEFAKQLFEDIYLPESEEDPVDELLSRSYRSYFYGQNNISSLAKKIAGSLDPKGFAEQYISETEATIDALCAAFADECPGINTDNYSVKIAQRFESIIRAAAKTKKKKEPHALSKARGSEAIDLAAVKEKTGIYLVAETESRCPNDGCTKSLYMRRNDGSLTLVYDLAVIDPDSPSDEYDNLIAMCPKCCAEYTAKRSADDILRMKAIKKKLFDAYEAREISSDQSVQDGIRFVIEAIPKLQQVKSVDLNFTPVPVRQKIAANNGMLYSKVQTYVNLYYPAVNDAFLELSTEGKIRFKPFCLQVRIMYLNYVEKGYDQDTIFFEMTKWLSDATNGNWSACEIVISFFIQKCEVFDVIPQ